MHESTISRVTTNKYVQNNLRLLEESYRKGKSVE
jgi:DNA-directed RNA polymerase specialized sigma54-like protein